MRLTLVLALVPLLISGPLVALEASADTDEDAGLWISARAGGRFDRGRRSSGALLWALDAQVRLLDDTRGFAEGVVRPSLGYQLTESMSLWLGYAWVRTSPEGASNFDEHRVWQQLTWARKLSSIDFSSRTRLEERIIDGGGEAAYRVRQRFRVDVPLNIARGLRWIVHDEVFVHLNNTDEIADSGLDQNRFFTGFGFGLVDSERVQLEIGYLNQFIDLPTDQVNHILAINIVLAP